MSSNTVLSLGIIATNVSVLIHTWQLRRHRELINETIDVVIADYDAQNAISNYDRQAHYRLVQRVDLLEERQEAPAPKVGRQWP